MTAEDLAELVQLKYRTCMNYLEELEENGHVCRLAKPADGQGGRPVFKWALAGEE